MTSLFRTARPRWNIYTPDGRGRDRYISYNNGGYWEYQFQIYTHPEYERPRYSNYHTLYHFAAPFKYYPDGSGRQSHIIGTKGLIHDQKPLIAYKLSDFLRSPDKSSFSPMRKSFKTIHERKYNIQLRTIENKIINRLYTIPMKQRKERMNSDLCNENSKDSDNNLLLKGNQSLPNLTDKRYRTFYPKKSKNIVDLEKMENFDNFNEVYMTQIKNKKLGKLNNKLRLNNTCKNLFRKSRNIKDYNTGGLNTLDIKFNKLKGFEYNQDVSDCGYNAVKQSKSFKVFKPGKFKSIKFTC